MALMGVYEIIAMNAMGLGLSLRVGRQVGKRADGARLEEQLGTFWNHTAGSKSQHVHLLQQAERLSPKLNSELSLPLMVLHADSESSKDTPSS
jgi:hypothetical protein